MGKRATQRLPRNILEEAKLPKAYDSDAPEATATDQTALIAPKSFRTQRRPTLMAIGGSLTGNVFRLDGTNVSIGRARSNTIVVPDEGVSRVHCEITADGQGHWFVEDRRSTNGTIHNGAFVARTELVAGDRIQVGSQAVFQFGFFDQAEEELAKSMYEAATRDVLTRALNRSAFYERFDAEISYALRHGAPLVAVLFDLDHFKAVNDTLGHAAGDEVLRQVGNTVAKLLRGEDIFARYGGEEFAIVARGLALAQGIKLAERVRAAVEGRVLNLGGRQHRVTISAGVAELAETTGGKRRDDLLRIADARLYKAKGAGRNRVVGG